MRLWHWFFGESKMEPPRYLPPVPAPQHVAENLALANEFAQPGTVKHFALRLGFMPHDEKDAEAIITRCIQELHWYERAGE